MPDSFRRVLLGLALGAALVLTPHAPAFAAEATDEHAEGAEPPAAQKTRKQLREERLKFAIRPRASKAFARTRESIDAERWADAESALGRLRLDKLGAHERAQAHRLYGYIAYGQGKNDDAILALRRALAEDALTESDRADVLFQIAQIQGVERRWTDSIATLEQWFESVERPNPVGYFLLALAHFQLEDLEAALLPAKKAVQISEVPQQAWLQLLLAIHLTQKDYAAATPVLDRLLALYPSAGKGYWVQLSALYGVTGDNDRALGVLEIAYRKGLLTEDADLRRLLQLMLLRGIPYRAASIFEKEIQDQRIHEDVEAFELLGISWILARDATRAEEPLARAAALAPKGDLYVRLAQVHLLQEEWKEAAAALRKGLDKGGLADPGGAQLMLGIAYYNEHRLREARSSFALAQQWGGTKQQAASWIEHIDRELQASQAIAGAAG